MWVQGLTGGAQSPFSVAEPGEVSKRLGEAAWPLPHAGGEAFHMSAPSLLQLRSSRASGAYEVGKTPCLRKKTNLSTEWCPP